MKMAKILSAVKPIQNHVKTISHLAIRFMASSKYTTLVGSSNFNNHLTTKWKPRNSISSMQLSTSSTNHQVQNTDHSSASSSSAIGNCNGNPCLDFFFHVVIPSLEWEYKYTFHKWKKPEESTALVKYLLPLAWSHNPLTALKLICNLQQEKFYCQEFLRAAYWLQQNHPKTLLSNVNTLAKSFGCFDELIEILHLLVVGQDKKKGEEKTVDVAKKAENMYETDTDYKLLHDQIAEVFAECLKSDLEQLKKQKSKASVLDPLELDDERYGNETCFEEVTFAALSCQRRYSDARNVCTNLLKNSIASKVFPRESYPEYQGLDEEDYMNRVWNRLKIEFLMPLDKYYRWYDGWSSEEPMSDVDKYLKEVKAGKSKIVADAMLPNEIIRYLDHWDFGKVAELQWKAMVENMRMQGKKMLKNCLAVCDQRCTDARGSKEVSAGLTLLVSELNEEPCWKGNLICHLHASKEPFNDSTKTDLQLIRGEDLRYKCEFLRRTNRTWKPDFVVVLDFLLQVALDENLKPEHMIKKVLVFGGKWDADRFIDSCWEAEYKEVQRKYEEKGYGDKVPHIVYWQLSKYESLKPVLPRTQPGVTILTGFSDGLVKLFLENDGEIRAEHYMELSVSGKGYESLSVVD